MKILVVCQHYWPEPYPLADVCEALVQRGHEVHVITDIPNYPMGHIYKGYRWWRGRHQVRNGVRITRAWTIGRRNNAAFRALNYFSYAISSTLRALWMREAYDVVFVYQTSPVMMASAGLAYARRWKKKALLYCLDLWPASLEAGGVGEHSAVYRCFHAISKFLYRRADGILISSKEFRSYLIENFGISDDKIRYLPQSSKTDFHVPAAPAKEADGIDLMFAGNVGAAQNLTTVLEAAELLRDRARIRWHILGDGSELENLKRMARAKQLDNVVFYGRRPAEEMPQYYAMADAMVLTLTANAYISRTLPGKVQSYMAAGKPILAAADGATREAIQESGCGFCASAEDAAGFAEIVQKFIACEDKAALGDRARAYYQEHFTWEAFIGNLEQALASCSAVWRTD